MLVYLNTFLVDCWFDFLNRASIDFFLNFCFIFIYKLRLKIKNLYWTRNDHRWVAVERPSPCRSMGRIYPSTRLPSRTRWSRPSLPFPCIGPRIDMGWMDNLAGSDRNWHVLTQQIHCWGRHWRRWLHHQSHELDACLSSWIQSTMVVFNDGVEEFR